MVSFFLSKLELSFYRKSNFELCFN